jgi:ribosome-binding factor A
METQRQKKIAGVIQKDLVEILQREATDGGFHGTIISVSKVSVTADLSQAKIYVSVFPQSKVAAIMEGINGNLPFIRNELAKRTKNQLRRVPELAFFHDDSLDYIEKIDTSLKKGENPIENPDLLPKRKKS